MVHQENRVDTQIYSSDGSSALPLFPSDEDAYKAYVNILGGLEKYHVEVDKAKQDEEWFAKHLADTKQLCDLQIKTHVVAGTSTLPALPLRHIVEAERVKIQQGLDGIRKTENEIGSYEYQIAEKRKEIDRRNGTIAIVAAIYFVGVFITLSITDELATALAWPVLCTVVLVVIGGFLGLIGGDKK